MYTFHCFRADGSPVALESQESPTPEAARAHARRVLSDHGTAQQVVVCLDDIEIAQVWREPV